jgi:hypothetical protein
VQVTEALPLQQVGPVHRAGGDVDDHLAGPAHRIGHLTPLERLGTTGFANRHRAHVSAP